MEKKHLYMSTFLHLFNREERGDTPTEIYLRGREW